MQTLSAVYVGGRCLSMLCLLFLLFAVGSLAAGQEAQPARSTWDSVEPFAARSVSAARLWRSAGLIGCPAAGETARRRRPPVSLPRRPASFSRAVEPGCVCLRGTDCVRPGVTRRSPWSSRTAIRNLQPRIGRRWTVSGLPAGAYRVMLDGRPAGTLRGGAAGTVTLEAAASGRASVTLRAQR